MIEIKDGSKSYGSLKIFEHINLVFPKSGMIMIQGASGCGKTTLLRMLSGLEQLDKGTMIYADKSAFIFQNYELIEELSGWENIFFKEKCEIDKEQQSILESLGILEFCDRSVDKLSFGQRQRIGIARALMRNPDVIFCDEPTESLDVQNKEIVLDLLKEYSKTHLVIIVTHDINRVRQIADEVYEIKNYRLQQLKVNNQEIEKHNEKEFVSILPDEPIIIKKIMKKRKRRLNILISSLVVLYLFSLSITVSLFTVSSTNDVLCKDLVMIGTKDKFKQEARETYEDSDKKIKNYFYRNYGIDDAKIAISFKGYVKEGRYYQAIILPFTKSQKQLEKGAVINQNCQGLNIGDNIELTYTVYGIEEVYKQKIVEQVNENDASWCGIYFDNDSVMNDFEKIQLFENENLRQALYKNPDYFYGTYKEDQLEELIGTVDVEIQFHNPFYEERLSFKEEIAHYKPIFNMILIVSASLIILLVLVLQITNFRRYAQRYTILNQSGCSKEKIRKYFVQGANRSFTLTISLSSVIATLFEHILFENLSYDEIIIYFIFVFIIILTNLLNTQFLKQHYFN